MSWGSRSWPSRAAGPRPPQSIIPRLQRPRVGLGQERPGGTGLLWWRWLQLLANCAPEANPLHLLLQPRPWFGDELGPEIAAMLVPLLEDPLAAKDAIAALRRHSLISPPADGAVSVHRLVQVITIAQMPVGLAAAWQQATAAVIEAALPADLCVVSGYRRRACLCHRGASQLDRCLDGQATAGLFTVGIWLWGAGSGSLENADPASGSAEAR